MRRRRKKQQKTRAGTPRPGFLRAAPPKAFPLRGRWREAPDEGRGSTCKSLSSCSKTQLLPCPHQSACGGSFPWSPREASGRRKCFESRIEDRSAEANDRSEIGHFEGDTIIGHGHRSCIVTLVDRKSRFLLAGKCALAVGARHEREHERTAAAVLFQGARTG